MKNPNNHWQPRIIAVVALISMLTVGAVGALRQTTTAPGNDEQAVREVLMQDAAAVERGDLAALDRLWANDESVLVFESGHANRGWTDYRNNHLAPELREMRNTRYRLTDIVPHVAGNTAWATFRYTIAADIGSRHIDSGGLGTAVLERRGGRWQIVHWHTSAPRRAAASPSPSPSN